MIVQAHDFSGSLALISIYGLMTELLQKKKKKVKRDML